MRACADRLLARKYATPLSPEEFWFERTGLSLMSARPELAKSARNEPQRFVDPSFHRWYDFVLGYPDHLVTDILSMLSVGRDQIVMDPFCGTGTTSIECAKHRIRSVGVDANPFAVFAANIKCSFNINPEELNRAADRVEHRYRRILETDENFSTDVTYLYLNESGMIERGWISPKPLRQALALREAIRRGRKPELIDPLMLALAADLAQKTGNMKYGPQIYKGRVKLDSDPLPYFRSRIKSMVEDLEDRKTVSRFAPAIIEFGDTRYCENIIGNKQSIDYVICSPPYPTEHDYTRHMRLELAFTDSVKNVSGLREIKRLMIRSNTKGLYKGDDDAVLAAVSAGVEAAAKLIEAAVIDKVSKFEKFYPWVVREYFGGMSRHFQSILPFLKSGAKAAYVVGDQAAYARVPIQTALLLGELAEHAGFRVKEIKLWRRRWATALNDFLNENILVLEKP
jgi:DNA modification methylase